MRNVVFFCFLLFIFCCESKKPESSQIWPLPYNPVANTAAMVVVGPARFTVLTPKLIRMEFSLNGKFEDRATVAFVNRQLPVPSFTSSQSNGVLTISTSALQLTYKMGQRFHNSTLNIMSLDTLPEFKWTYGMKNWGNLLGTIRSLDQVDAISLNCSEISDITIHDESLHCTYGLISRNGWSLVNDTQDWAFGQNGWWASPNNDTEDLYFFGYGWNYMEALQHYTMVGGKIVMAPRYSMGIWWSIWTNLNNQDVRKIVESYKLRSLPLDVYILDMDWHTKDGWGGYTFDTRLFPIPSYTLNYLRNEGLYVGANLHDADGVRPTEKMYTQMATALGINPSEGRTIPFNIANISYAFALEDIVLRDVENQGIDFWWNDWQQGGSQGGCTDGAHNPTIMLNHLRSTDHTRHTSNLRSLVLGRWGGLGNHRYPIGFSGDVAIVSWANLAYQPYFSWTASNVGYGFWSHDLVGPHDDHELHVRWIQWGAFSGVFRTHDRGMASGSCAYTDKCFITQVWDLPTKYYEAIHDAMMTRVSLVPYIYTALRQAYDNGVSIIRPMYYYFPDKNTAYAGNYLGNFSQYLFGDDILVAPVVSPSKSNTSLATKTIWIPPGTWFDHNSGIVYTGERNLTLSYALSQIPLFFRGGAIIPRVTLIPGDTLGVSHRQYTHLKYSVYPGSDQGQCDLYDDDGITWNYLNSGGFSWTSAKFLRDPLSGKFVFQVDPTVGNFEGQLLVKSYTLEIINSLPPTMVTVNGAIAPYNPQSIPNTWHYEGSTLSTIIEIPPFPISQEIIVVVMSTPPTSNIDLSGISGKIKNGVLAKKVLDLAQVTPGAIDTTHKALLELSSSGDYLSYLAGMDLPTFNGYLKSIESLFMMSIDEVLAIKPKESSQFPLWENAMELLIAMNKTVLQ